MLSWLFIDRFFSGYIFDLNGKRKKQIFFQKNRWAGERAHTYIWGENFELPVSCGRNCALRSLRNLIRLHRWDLLLNSHDFVVWGLFRKILDLGVQHSSVTILGFGFSLFKLLLDFSHFALSGRLKQHRGNLVWLRRCYLSEVERERKKL